MPKRTDLHSILVIGSGPIVIGQGCEFDYSGTQACKALKEEGFKVVLVNSNPATIMTDPELADRTYIEPIIPSIVEKIIAKERPDALLPTLGGQTALNVAVALSDQGVLQRYDVEMIGANATVIKKAEAREQFKEAMQRIGLETPRSGVARSIEEAKAIAKQLARYPLIIRPSFTLAGTGGGIAYNVEEFEELATRGMDYSPSHEILIEESLIGWKEFELELMRDVRDNVVVICSIENIDPMGVHTGDSITIAPAQTLTDKCYQQMRDAAIAIMREIGVETGGSNIQFAVDPKTGRMVVIEMNPRVSRSSALASKATGFPIAKIAAKLAVGYSLDEIPNDITRQTPSSFEPTIDYCVVKIPRWDFEKFPDADRTLTTQMKSVGEAMAIGRTFKEALQKAIRSLETGRTGFGRQSVPHDPLDPEELRKRLRTPSADRLEWLYEALQQKLPESEIAELTKIDPWFIRNLTEVVEIERRILESPRPLPTDLLREAKQNGFSDRQLAQLLNHQELDVRRDRLAQSIQAAYKLVDTCAAEFEAYTPYYYSTYELEDEVRTDAKPRVLILGGGPNRIGQGIEFDYCCVHASFALREEGICSIMLNSNPETVSTDYDVSDRLYFEPITLEDVLNVVEKERPIGVILQFGGQTPLRLAVPLSKSGVRILGTSPDNIDRAEDRKRFNRLIVQLGLRQPDSGIARSHDEAKRVCSKLGYPVLVRPSYVLGGRAMSIVYDDAELAHFIGVAISVSGEHPVLIDKFLEDAIEVDVDAISDGHTTIVAGIMEHIEHAGIHSGDSAMVLPSITLDPSTVESIRQATTQIAQRLGVCGLMNVQFAVKRDQVYVLEVNPRASRTVPFVSKATGVPLAKLATKVMLGKQLHDIGLTEIPPIKHVAVKESVFPFNRFPGVDAILGPEMRSTGEVMGIDSSFGLAFAKSQLAAGQNLSLTGTVFISVRNEDKRDTIFIAKKLIDLGFQLVATRGTARTLMQNDIPVTIVNKLHEGRPHVIDLIKNGQIQLLINTPGGRLTKKDETHIRSEAVLRNVPLVTTIAGAQASVNGLEAMIKKNIDVKPIQEYLLGK